MLAQNVCTDRFSGKSGFTARGEARSVQAAGPGGLFRRLPQRRAERQRRFLFFRKHTPEGGPYK
jgi:hypothetical protein